jgi:cytochrome oxidase assembly protein ShyY1
MVYCKTEACIQPTFARTQYGLALIPVLLVMLTLVAGCASVWQWQRSVEHTFKAINAADQLSKPQNLNSVDNLLTSYVTVTGKWVAGSTTFVSPRLMNGQLGAQVVSVFSYNDAMGQARFIAVQRGWAAQPSPAVTPALTELTSSEVSLEGQLVSALPKAFELKSIAPTRLGLWQNYELFVHSEILKIALHPKILVLLPTSPDVEREQLRRVPAEQAIDALKKKADTNRGYALQWLGLSLVGLMGLAWMWRSRLQP